MASTMPFFFYCKKLETVVNSSLLGRVAELVSTPRGMNTQDYLLISLNMLRNDI